MYKFISYFLLIFLSNLFYSQDSCSHIIILDSKELKKTGHLFLYFKNTGNFKYEIPKTLNLCNLRLTSLEIFNVETNNYEKIKLSNKDVDCFKTEKRKGLKPNRVYTYDINIKNDFDVLEHTNFFDDMKTKKYRFKLYFNLFNYRICKENNEIETDWIYKD